MENNFRIALRFLTARRRSMLMSLAGIVFGVGFFIVTQAQTSGFEGFFIKTIIGTNGAIRIEDKYQDMTYAMPVDAKAPGPGQFEVSTAREGRRYVEGVENPDDILAALRNFANVSGASLVVRGSVVADSSFRNDTAQVFGVRLQDHLAVSDLARQIVLGSLADYRETTHGLLIGRVLADRLKVTAGDALILASGEQRVRFRVSAIYETGVSDIDRVRLYVHLTAARSLLRRASGASFIQVGLYDHTRAPLDVTRMEEVFRHGATSWQEREKTWLEVFRALRVSSALTVSTIILISGLGMFNTLAMIVMEKTKEIAILRSMGYTRKDISNIFLLQGAIVLVIGTVLGWAFGAGVTYAVSQLPIRIRGIFTTDSFVVAWSVWHYVAATVTATVVVFTASLIPARRAARLEPGEIIRGTSQ